VVMFNKTACAIFTLRMGHFVHTKNLPYSLTDIREMTSQCEECQQIKTHFVRSNDARLIKATQVFERLNMDFKGPLPSAFSNKYFLTVVDEYSRFPFAFPCSDMTAKTVIQCLTQLFSIFGMCSYIHSDRWSSFQSHELKSWLHSHGVATSRTASFNPSGNGQFNGTRWKAIQCSLKSRQLRRTHWEDHIPCQDTLSDALHSIRSLFCTSTNCTPHERMFHHARPSVNETSIPSWLKPGPIYVKRHVRNKDEPLVDEAELLEVNPSCAHVRLGDGRETTVSIRDLSPRVVRDDSPPSVPVLSPRYDDRPIVEGRASNEGDNEDTFSTDNSSGDYETQSPVRGDGHDSIVETSENTDPTTVPLRRSTRVRKPVDRYGVVPYK